MPMPRASSGELCVALERVAHIAVEDNELGGFITARAAFAPSSASSSRYRAGPSRRWRMGFPKLHNTGLAALRVAAAHAGGGLSA